MKVLPLDKFFAACGLPGAVLEHKFHPTRRWRFDVCWPERKIALEIDGGVWTGGRHTRGKGYVNDMEKLNHGLLLGWRPFRCTPEQLNNGYAVSLIEMAFKERP